MQWKTALWKVIVAFLIVNAQVANVAWGMDKSFMLAGIVRLRAQQSLYEAAARNNPRRVLELLLTGVPANQRDTVGKTAFDYAVKYGRLTIIKILLKFDPLATQRVDDRGRTALHHAAKHNQVQVIRLLAEYDSSLIDFPDKQGKTPLHLACAAGHAKPTRELLARGANPNLQDAAGDNGWSYAARGPEKTWRKVVAALKSAQERRREQRMAIEQTLNEPGWNDLLKILYTYADCHER